MKISEDLMKKYLINKTELGRIVRDHDLRLGKTLAKNFETEVRELVDSYCNGTEGSILNKRQLSLF